MITAHEVQTARFRRAAPGVVGYDEVSVDEFLDRAVATLDAIEHGAPLGPNALTSAEVVDAVFAERSAQVNGGYDLDDVDDLLDRVAQRLFGYEQQNAPRSADEAPVQEASSERVVLDDEAAAGFPDESFSRVDDGGVADARALAAAESDLDSRESDVAGAAYAGASFAAEDDASADETLHEHEVEQVQAPVADAEAFESAGDVVVADETVDERPMHVIFDSADSREQLAPGSGENAESIENVARQDDAAFASSAPAADSVDAVEESSSAGDSAESSGGINPVGADPVDDSVVTSSGGEREDRAQGETATSEPVHPVGSSVDGDAAADSVMLQQAEAAVTPEERFDASRRDDVVNETMDVEHALPGAEFDPADVPSQRATDEVRGADVELDAGEPVDDGFDPFGADSIRPQSDSLTATTVGESWIDESPAEESLDTAAPVGLTIEDQSEPEIVSYRATDHRVPLPRGDVRSHLSDADLEAESHYHPEFSTYAGQSDGTAGAGGADDAPVDEPVAPESSMPAPETEPEVVAHDARDDVEVHGPGRSDASEPAPMPALTPVEPAPGQVSDAAGGGRADEEEAYTPTHFVERAEPSAVPAMRDVTPVESADAGIGRPEPIDRPSPIDVDEPEAIERPSALPPRDDTSRKGILRRIFKG